MIRGMQRADLSQCGAIYAKAFPAEHWGIDWTAENAAAYLTDLFEQKRFVGYVDEENGRITGCILAVRRLCGSKEELHIDELAVLPECQGQGIGRRLLQAIREHCRAQRLAGIVLYTSEHAPAFGFYEKNGFVVSRGTVCMYLSEQEP